MSVYGILSIGIHLHVHYCCGKVSDFSLYEPVKSCCAHDHESNDEGPSFNSNCCDFEHYDLTIDESHQASFMKLAFPRLISEKISTTDNVTEQAIAIHVPSLPTNGPPPDVPLFIKHQSLVLYA